MSPSSPSPTTAPLPTAAPSAAPAVSGPTLSSMPPGLPRFLAVSTLISTVVVFGVVAGALLAYDGDVAQSLIVGAFVSFWGGPGFGVIAGIALHQLRADAAPRDG